MLPILYAGNEAMFDGVLISLLSVLRHTKEPLNVFLLTMDLTDMDARYKPLRCFMADYLERLCRNVNGDSRVTLIDAGQLYRETLGSSPNGKTGYTPYCFLRLFAHRIKALPSKILYLDTDTVVNKDLSPLFAIDLEGFEYAAALDHYGKWFMGYHYINSGVMLLNLDRIRQTGLFEKALALCAKKRLFLPDQTAIHRLTQRKYILPAIYNQQKRYDREDTVIQHFTKTILWLPYFHTRNIKPWQTEQVGQVLTHRYDGLLQEYLAEKRNFECERMNVYE